MKWRINWPVLLLTGCLSVSAQDGMTGFFPVDPVNLIRELIGHDASFSATAQISGFSTNANDDFVVDAEYAMLEGQLRTVVDLGQIRGLNACDIAQGHLKDSGMDLAISLKLPALKQAFTIYPRARAYVETRLTWHEEVKEIAEISKTKLRDETFDDHPCIQYAVHVINKLGAENDVRVWEATDLDNFPVQIRFETRVTTFNIRFRDVKREPPDIELFQPPGNFDRFTSLPELSRAVRGR